MGGKKELLEEGEVDAAVLAMLHEVGMLREVVVLAVLEDEDAVLLQESLFENKVGNGGQFLQGVWRVGKDEVELQFAGFEEAEDIAPEN